MASFTISQCPDDTPQARLSALDGGERFISIDFGTDTTLILHGVDAKAVANARRLATELMEAANQIEDVLIAREKMAG